MQFKLLVVKVLLNFMVSFQGKLHAMYYLIDCFLLLNIHLFPPPVFSLISRDDNDFSGRKGERLTELTRDLPEEQACRREVAAKTDSFSGTPLCNIFTVGVWDSTAQELLSSSMQAARLPKPDVSSKCSHPHIKQKATGETSTLLTDAAEGARATCLFLLGMRVLELTCSLEANKFSSERSYPKCKYLVHRSKFPSELTEELGWE